MAACASAATISVPEEKTASAKRLGNKLFFPALAIPVVTVIGVLLFNNLPSWQVALFGPGNHATLITLFSMTVGTLIGGDGDSYDA